MKNIRKAANLEYITELPIYKYSKEQQIMIAANIGAIELTQGCSIGCYFCGVEAQKGVTGVMAFSALERFLGDYGHLFKIRDVNRLPLLYYATDPLDYQDPKTGQDYRDVLRLFKEAIGKYPVTITAVPKGKENLWMELLADKEITLRTSLSVMNRERLKSYLGNKFKADGKDIYVFEGDCHYPPEGEEQSGFKHLELSVNDFKGPTFSLFSTKCRDVDRSVMSLGREKEKLSPRGIGCFNGVLMRPAAVQNVASIRTSQKYPLGLYLSEIPQDPGAFKVFRLTDKRRNRFAYTTTDGRKSVYLFDIPLSHINKPEELVIDDNNDHNSIPIEIELEKILAANGADTFKLRKKLNKKIADWFGQYYAWCVPKIDADFNFISENPSDGDLKIIEYIKRQNGEDRELLRNSIKKYGENLEKRKREYQSDAVSETNI